jgi:hypothetical protein
MRKFRDICDRLGQAEVVKQAGVSKSTICRVYNGNYGADPSSIINKVLEICGGEKIEAIPEGFMKDRKGCYVPVNIVSAIDKKRDRLVRSIVRKGSSLAVQLADFKRQTIADIQTFMETAALERGVEFNGGKGNVTMHTYDGQFKIIKDISERFEFNEQLQIAKQLIDECLKEWTKDSGDELKTIINSAFAVDRKGRINTKAILALRRHDIKHPKWTTAMELITESLIVTDSSISLRIYERDSETGKYRQLPLAVSKA